VSISAGARLLVLALVVVAPVATGAQEADVIFERAIVDFEAGRLAESVAGFDTLAGMSPEVAAQLWQRGIALYYAGRFDDCRAQFELHRTVNPNDVENAAWHYLCVARASTPAAARKALLPVGPDSRVPMREIYRMFQGDLSPDVVMRTGSSVATAAFYAHLYVGLYHDARGETRQALEHIRLAADERYRRAGGYMHMVARVHLALRDGGR